MAGSSGNPIVFDNNHIQMDPTTFAKKRKRPHAACVRCHERKIKCASPGAPCRSCRAAGVPCVLHVDGRTRAGSLSAILDDNDDNDGGAGGSGSSQDVSHTALSRRPHYGLPPPPPLLPPPPPSVPRSISPAPRAPARLSTQRFEAYVQDHLGAYAPSFRRADEEVGDGGGGGGGGGGSGSSSGDSASSGSSGRRRRRRAATASATVPATATDSHNHDDDQAVISTADAAAVLSSFSPVTTAATAATATAADRLYTSYPYQQNAYPYAYPYPYAQQQQPLPPMAAVPQATPGLSSPGGGDGSGPGSAAAAAAAVEVEMGTRATAAWEAAVAELDAADAAYLRAKGAFALPAAGVQAALVGAFFRDVHPTVPVLGRGVLTDAAVPVSRLLLFAVFTAAARVCRHAALLDAAGTNRASAWRFYRATRALLDTGYERDRVVVAQALLLLTWWWDKKDDGGRNMRSCAVDAINTAQSLGMHRWDQYPSDPVLRGQWKRIWWSCVNRDVGVAVGHGLPCMLSMDDADVPALEPADFDDETLAAAAAAAGPDAAADGDPVAFMLEQTRVAEALRHIHGQFFVRKRLRTAAVMPPGTGTDPGLQLCRAWLRSVPPAMQYDVDDVPGHRFWPAFLHVLFYGGVMLRFREASVRAQAAGASAAARRYAQARGIAAATAVSKILRNMQAHGHVQRCTGQLTSVLFSCLLFFLVEGHLAGAGAAVRADARRKYTLCLHALYGFSQVVVSAALVHRLFEALQASLLGGSPGGSSSGGASAGGASSGVSSSGDGTWHTLFPGYETSSDLPASYVRDLLETDFYEDTPLDSLSVPSGTGWALPSPEDLWPAGLEAPSLFGGLPTSLDVDTWLAFFQGNADGKL